MDRPWYLDFGWWLCEKIGHPFPRKGWIYNGQYHRECRICGRLISETLQGKNNG